MEVLLVSVNMCPEFKMMDRQISYIDKVFKNTATFLLVYNFFSLQWNCEEATLQCGMSYLLSIFTVYTNH